MIAFLLSLAPTARAAELFDGQNEDCRLLGSFTVTTYADTPEDQEIWVGQTASGALPIVGRTVAVDPEIIPLGTWLFIEKIGFRRAEDVGGLVKGFKIDLLVDKSGETYKNRLVWIVTGGFWHGASMGH
jgi:3D (Asp-Asp-Asp) domain-containing protein